MIKLKYMTMVLLCSLCMTVLPACGSGRQENIDQGMKLIEQLSYEEALKCFDAALLNKEDARLSYRGQQFVPRTQVRAKGDG